MTHAATHGGSRAPSRTTAAKPADCGWRMSASVARLFLKSVSPGQLPSRQGEGDMIRALLVLGFAAFLAGAPAHAQAPAPRVALIIGNAAYTSAPRIATRSAEATIVAETMRTA